LAFQDIVFINLPTPFLEDSSWIYPIGLVQLATYAQSRGFKVKIEDLSILSGNNSINRKIANWVKTILCHTIGVSVTTPQASFLPVVALSANKSSRLIAGGPHASILPEEVLALGFDTVVCGEGEYVLPDIIWKPILLFDRKIIPPQVDDLDSLPFPDRSLVSGYKGPIPIMASRGCPYRCAFCSRTGVKYRRRSPENVVEELESIKEEEIIFYDDTFTIDYEWVMKLHDLMIAKGIKKKLRCSTRADRITTEIAKVLKDMGFNEICVGVESGSNKILKVLGKGVTSEQNAIARQICHNEGIRFTVYMMLGCPGETEETLLETLNWLDENKPDKINLYLYHPMPGSDVWNNCEDYDIEFEKNYDFTYYGGKRDRMFSVTRTSSLSYFEITRFYYHLMERFQL
jgi:anaerobic magnesium-protoporphyrin IX monomethyl ester cyclase